MKALVTGSEGFVGRYMRQELQDHGYEVIGLDRIAAPETLKADMLDAESVLNAVAAVRPDILIHLAAQADVHRSWKEPGETIRLNLEVSVNLLEALRKTGTTDTRVVLVGSSDQYGVLGAAGIRVDEKTNMKPGSPYAVSKKAQEEMARLYVQAYGMNICMTRSFNHGGAGQRPGFMIPDFASGIVRIERGEAHELLVGNLASRRDFTHVKDVVRAYRLIAEKGRPGEVYNVGSGTAWSAREILDKLCEMARCPVTVRQDPSRMRPSDTPVICCDHSKLTEDTGWKPELSVEAILADTLDYYRSIPGTALRQTAGKR